MFVIPLSSSRAFSGISFVILPSTVVTVVTPSIPPAFITLSKQLFIDHAHVAHVNKLVQILAASQL